MSKTIPLYRRGRFSGIVFWQALSADSANGAEGEKTFLYRLYFAKCKFSEIEGGGKAEKCKSICVVRTIPETRFVPAYKICYNKVNSKKEFALL